MVSNRCKLLVKSEIEKLGFYCIHLALGYADIEENISKQQYDELNESLKI
jgi:hypothetical protein